MKAFNTSHDLPAAGKDVNFANHHHQLCHNTKQFDCRHSQVPEGAVLGVSDLQCGPKQQAVDDRHGADRASLALQPSAEQLWQLQACRLHCAWAA